MVCKSGFLCQFIHLHGLLLGPTKFWVANHDILILVGSDRELQQNYFWYICSARCGPRSAVSVLQFTVPSTTRSHLSDDVVLDWERIQSPLENILAGFVFFQVKVFCSQKRMTSYTVPSTFLWFWLCNTDHRTFSCFSLSLSLATVSRCMLSLLSLRETCQTGASNIVQTPNSPVFSRVIFEKSEMLS